MTKVITKSIGKLVIICVLVCAIVLNWLPASVSAASTAKRTVLYTVKSATTVDGTYCTSLACIGRYGNTLYAVKASTDNGPALLYEYTNFEKSTSKLTKYTLNKKFSHLNGMCMVGSTMYLVDGTKKIYKLDVSNPSKISEIPLSSDDEYDNVWSITSYKNGQFIFKTKLVNSGSQIRFAIGSIKDGKMQIDKYFNVNNKEKVVNQDICYSNDRLYIATSDKPTTGSIKKNTILDYNMSTKEVEREIEFNGNDNYQKVEIEGMCKDKDGNLLVCTNANLTSGTEADKIVKITKIYD